MTRIVEIVIPEGADVKQEVLDIDVYRLRAKDWKKFDGITPGSPPTRETMIELVNLVTPEDVDAAEDVPLILLRPIFMAIIEQVAQALALADTSTEEKKTEADQS